MLNSGDINSCVQDLLDLTEEYKQLEVIIAVTVTVECFIKFFFLLGHP